MNESSLLLGLLLASVGFIAAAFFPLIKQEKALQKPAEAVATAWPTPAAKR